ncbi:glycosyltransferase family 4 protein, partial [Candidatus Woesearchaeota archaeon]|nr:glycosyltransferase family 4 protein [Candidatus Woesearchaeota archaeon]
MRILFVLANYHPNKGGLEIVFKNLAESLVKQGHEVVVVTHKPRGSPTRESVNGVLVDRVRCFHNRYLFTFAAVPKALKWARWADIIHTTTFNGAPPAWLASRLTGKRVLITVHEVWVGRWKEFTEFGLLKRLLHEFLERCIYSLPYDSYACVSKSTLDNLRPIISHPERAQVVYNGVEEGFLTKNASVIAQAKKLRKEYGIDKDFVIGFHGRPGVSKGVEYLIRALPLVLQRIPNAKLMMYLYSNPAEKRGYDCALKLIDALGIKDKVVMARNELPAVYLAADVMAVPSLGEGFGFNVVNPCIMGVPVVASNTSSIPEVISGKYVLVRPKDPEALAQGILMVAKKKYHRSPIKKFPLEKNVERYV